jgi:hypothetical protein
MNLTATIKACLDARGWTATKLSKESGVPIPCITRVLSGERQGMHSKNLLKLAPFIYGQVQEQPSPAPAIPPWVKLSPDAFTCLSCGAVHPGPLDARRTGPDSPAELFVGMHQGCPAPWKREERHVTPPIATPASMQHPQGEPR